MRIQLPHSLRSRNAGLFRLAWAQGLSALAGTFLMLALVFYGAQEANVTGLGLLFAAKAAPTLVIALIGGVLADSWSRVKIASGSMATIGVVNVVLAYMLPIFGLSWQVQLLVLVSGFATAVGAPSLYALLPAVVAEEELVRGNAVVRSFRNVGNVVGPGIAVVIAHVVSFQAIILITAFLNVVSALLIARINPVMATRQSHSSSTDWQSVWEVLRQNRWLFFAVPFWGVFIAIHAGAADVTQSIHVVGQMGSGTWSIMMTTMSIGYILGSLVSLKLKVRSLFTTSVLFASLSILQLLASGFSDSVFVLGGASLLTGIGFEISGVLWGASLQSRVPDEQMGRASSFDYAVSFGLTPAGYVIFGFFSISIAVPVLAISSCILALLTAIGVCVGIKLDRRETVKRLVPEV
ncbi:MFS family permease [Arcanobacterium wilhelmae]|uniref:MFS family permease n=1 Tax=Arcanobacterium wilhelmae TaxID=1803177 RepID=A0ABT9NB03_9ACTO|nr:MFS transporter [Arcanobacterium wilhelmae]MDP9800581.1 MFS family permease [Arcanobacterium wilhelmae]